MNSSVLLQDPFSYKALGMIIAGAVTAALIVAYLLLRFLKKKAKKEKAKEEHHEPRKPRLPWEIKNRYMDEIGRVEGDLTQGKIDVREAYQQMSLIMRRFVKELTGLDATTSTLADIRAYHTPQLEELIREYYAPEFSGGEQRSIQEAMDSMARTKKVIAEWN